jgi:predicted DNA-binding transcriptional regulator AlpA
MDQSEIAHLARELAARIAPDSLLDADDVAALLKVSARQVLTRYVGSPGFPRSIRLQSAEGHRGHPKWLRADVTAWIESQRSERPPRTGRPRRPLPG